MSQHGAEYDATVVQLNDNRSSQEDVPFPAVAVSPGHQAPRNVMYIAQQTSLEDYTPGLNPLVNAAAHLLLDMVKFRNNHQEDMESLRARLEAEVRGFEAKALASEVEHSHVLAARYVLCTAIDESITTSRMGESGSWSRLALLSTFHNETWGGEKFFQILDRCMQQPARNLYLLELMYLLLSLGFEGKYRVLDRGPIALESLRDKIYRQIRLLRGEPSPDLCKKIETANLRDKVYAYIPTWLVAAAVFFCISVSLWGFSFVLQKRAEPVVASLQKHAPKAINHVVSVPVAHQGGIPTPVLSPMQAPANTGAVSANGPAVRPAGMPPVLPTTAAGNAPAPKNTPATTAKGGRP